MGIKIRNIRSSLALIIILAVLMFSSAVAGSITGKILTNQIWLEKTKIYSSKLHIRSFERVYEILKSKWILFDSEKAMLQRVLLYVAVATNNVPPKPVLGNDNQENFKMVKDWLTVVFESNSSQAENIFQWVVRGMVRPDRFSYLLNAGQLQMFLYEPSEDEYIGDGVVIGIADGQLVVFITIAGTPADKAGFEPGDKILKINDVSFENLTSADDLRSRLKKLDPGKLFFTVGNKIAYEVSRDNGDTVEKLTLQTEVIKMGVAKEKQVVTSHLDGQIGIITIKNFNPGMSKLFLKELNKLMAENIKGLIIDLRNNHGGSVAETLVVVKALTGKGFILSSRGSTMVVDLQSITGPQFSGPIAVLVNERSASAAEILAACLQEAGATLFGQVTYGKNCAQNVELLPNRTFLFYTVYFTATPSGKTWPNGITPDHVTAEEETYEQAKLFLEEQIKEKTSE